MSLPWFLFSGNQSEEQETNNFFSISFHLFLFLSRKINWDLICDCSMHKSTRCGPSTQLKNEVSHFSSTNEWPVKSSLNVVTLWSPVLHITLFHWLKCNFTVAKVSLLQTRQKFWFKKVLEITTYYCKDKESREIWQGMGLSLPLTPLSFCPCLFLSHLLSRMGAPPGLRQPSFLLIHLHHCTDACWDW